ncbi:MAG TPA: hypothetical protein VFH73_10230 [Polyangia bacterium]|jgi:hypothetical protein|nr:hypothetical protein [Polyangia bacterium]
MRPKHSKQRIKTALPPARVAAALTILAIVSLAAPARSAPAFVHRSIVLPQGDVALDLGLGIGRAPVGPTTSVTGLGMNLELRGGLSSGLEIGFRTGLRFESEGRYTRADNYGRTWETETYPFGNDSVANPELRLRWLVARGPGAQLGLELRGYLPFESGTRFGIMLGLPVSLHVGSLRIDTGVFVPIIFTDPTWSAVSVPFHLWIQASGNVWLGPLLGVRVINYNGGSYNQYPLGFGLGIGLNSAVDFRTWFFFPNFRGDQATRTFGVGFALQVRFE